MIKIDCICTKNSTYLKGADMRLSGLALMLVGSIAQADVIECKSTDGKSLLTNEATCPPGTTFKRQMTQGQAQGDNLLRSIPPRTAQQPTRRPNLQAGVLECYVGESQIMYTTAQFCPAGTRFKGINFNTRDPGIAAAQGSQNSAPVIQVKRSCETLKQLRNHYDRMLEPGINKEPDTMQKLRDVQKEMHENGCRI